MDDDEQDLEVITATLMMLATAYKERTAAELEQQFPQRLAQADKNIFEGKTLEENLQAAYMQGVLEALDTFSVEELVAALTQDEGFEA